MTGRSAHIEPPPPQIPGLMIVGGEQEHVRAIAGGELLGWLYVAMSTLTPRLFIIGFWIFSDLLGDAYSSWVIPAIGFLILPWTTCAYMWAWSISSNEVSGWEWLLVAAGLLADLTTYVAARALVRGR